VLESPSHALPARWRFWKLNCCKPTVQSQAPFQEARFGSKQAAQPDSAALTMTKAGCGNRWVLAGAQMCALANLLNPKRVVPFGDLLQGGGSW
jgi:hypothetical protein